MAKNKEIYHPKDARMVNKTGSAGVQTDVISAGAEGSKVLGLTVTGSSGSTAVYYYDGTTAHLIWSGTTPANIDILRDVTGTSFMTFPKTSAGNNYFNIPAGSKIQMFNSAGTSTVKAYLEDY